MRNFLLIFIFVFYSCNDLKKSRKENESVESEAISIKNDSISYGDNIFNGADILVFENSEFETDNGEKDFGRIILIIKKNDLLIYTKVIPTTSKFISTNVQKAKIVNNKIVSNEFPNNVYVISNRNFTIKDVETSDVIRTYEFNELESSCGVEKYFK